MSTKLSFKAALERQGATTTVRPEESVSRTLSVALLAVGPIEQPVAFIKLLFAHGVSLRRARMTLDRLALRQLIALDVMKNGASDLLKKLHDMNVVGSILETPSEIDVKKIRIEQGLSQPEFACLYGLEVDTLKNWEQGRNVPDLAARLLLKVIEVRPRAVVEARGCLAEPGQPSAFLPGRGEK